MRYFNYLLMPLVAVGALSFGAESNKLYIIKPQVVQLDELSVAEAAETESEKHADGGYIANTSVVDCFTAMSYQYTGGRYENETIYFRLRMPEKTVPGKKYPLLIWLHGAGESGDDNSRQLSHIQSSIEFLAGQNSMDFYLLATQCPADNTSWTTSVVRDAKGDAPLTVMKEILDIILEEYPIDQNRISIYGQCSGAHGAFEFLKLYPNMVSAIAAFATVPPDNFVWSAKYRNTSFWAFNNEDDTMTPAEPMRRFVAQINATNGLAYHTVRAKGGHDAWTRGLKDDKIVAWLVLQDRTQWAAPPGVIVQPHVNTVHQFFIGGLPAILLVSLISLVFYRSWRIKI